MKRRDFILATGSIGLGLVGISMAEYFFKRSTKSKRGKILGGGKGFHDGQEIKFLSILDLDLNQNPTPPQFLVLNFMPHGLDFHPSQEGTVVAFEKKGPGACEVDLNTGKLTRYIQTVPERYFYGHGVYSPDGKLLYSTETNLETGAGVIAVRDSQDMKIIGQFPSFGDRPHECKWLENGKVLAITNGGGDFGTSAFGSVTYVEVESQKLLEKFEIDDPKFNTGHLAMSKNKNLVVVSAPRLGLPTTDLGAISFLSPEKKLLSIKEPKAIAENLKAETLSVAIVEQKQIAAITSPAGNFISFWNLQTGQFVSKLELDSPRGVVLTEDQKTLAVSHGDDGGIVLVDVDQLKPTADLRYNKMGFSGSHLYQT